jgi:hypothetical protein
MIESHGADEACISGCARAAQQLHLIDLRWPASMVIVGWQLER